MAKGKTASRDLLKLIQKEILVEKDTTGKGVYYVLNPFHRGH
jgi:hypothetical protein